MTDKHPITPPATLVAEWASESLATQSLCTKAARWGADQELEACLEVIAEEYPGATCDGKKYNSAIYELVCDARRPKPPSLKEQALEGLDKVGSFTLGECEGCSHYSKYKTYVDNIRRALETLPEGAQ
jgi:hypothetical protein